ncbi:serine--tRNA ligase [Pseudovibrio sp. Tun.PSC04-5.I4]|uniref:serine--tRNA ligase n=1 Tax=Pseudovibrio sp. Tun.PSC04-5.I4 TaxID=1798213 RepID=UPI00087E7870|nr:serine--tRNA ligase [Pseudovibrio sp. Tun.PSC04-5.I4]SDR04592.1 seryl-tRNA synthetase [Pseudovibrio sp. Tun.PSC04-5.I4]
MLDIKWIRENQESFDAALAKRGQEPRAALLVELDDARRSHTTKLQEAQQRRNSASKEIGMAMGQGDKEKAAALKTEVAEIKSFIRDGEEEQRQLNAAVESALAVIPNIPHEDVPLGANEDDNVLLHTHGEKPTLDFEPKEHYELGEQLGGMDFETAVKMSGSRFVLLKGQIARLERAIGQFMIDLHTQENGYTEVSPPLLVRDNALHGTGQLPKFAEDLFRTTNDHWLIPTAEVPLTNMVAGETLSEADLPIRVAALTYCFRSEAGSAGRDTAGMLRQHQFQKCELVSITDENSSMEELERMRESAEKVLKRLGLHYRVVTLCVGDMGFGARKTYDIEVWLPGQDAFREISSCSVCGDFQGRRMNARYRVEGEKALKFVHTLNGSGLAVGRCVIAVMENYQNADGTITVPEVLRPYMNGLEVISA